MRSLSRCFELTTELLDVEDIGALLQRIAESVKEIFGFRLVSISILDDTIGVFADHAMAGYLPEEEVEIRNNPQAFSRDDIVADFKEDCRVSKIAYFIPVEKATGDLESFVVVQDKEGARLPRKSPDSWHELDLLYFMLLNRRGNLIGYLQVDYPLDGKLPPLETVEEIELFAGIAAVAIENSRMFKRANDLLTENEVKTTRILQLLELIQSVLRIDDIDTVLQKVSDVMAATFGFRKTSVSLFTEGSDRVTVHAMTGYEPGEEEVVRKSAILKHKVLEDFKEQFRITRTGYFIPGESQGDVSEFVFVEDPTKVMAKRTTPDSWHELDLLYFGMFDRDGKMLGYLQPDYPKDGKIPTKETIQAMEAFASIATIAIENSSMFKGLNQAKEQVRMYLDLLTHDVGNLVSPVNTYLEIVLGTTTLSPVQHKYISSAHEASRSMIHLIRNIRRSAQMLESKETELVPVNLSKSIHQASMEAKSAFLGKKVVIRATSSEQDTWVVADNFLDEVIYNLLTNAIKYDDHEEVVIDVETRPEELEGKSYISVRIIDRGVGIPDEFKEKVFSKDFRKLPRSERLSGQRAKGAGMGLSIVSSLVNRYAGKIWIENRVYEDYSRGSVFNLLLPKA
jgi:signal transduction histidine kinase/uncharacterized protein YigA (DUF484 family)